MARAALQIEVRELAKAAGVSPTTITRLERGEALYPRTIAAIRNALEAAGVGFIEQNGGGPGVRLRRIEHSLGKGEVEQPKLRSVGPEDEDRAGPEAPDE